MAQLLYVLANGSTGRTTIHDIDITLGNDEQLVRKKGVVAKLVAKEEKSATLKLLSGKVRYPKTAQQQLDKWGMLEG
ncbi:hypothetical protein R6Q57_015674, partial [Mikania cordata]